MINKVRKRQKLQNNRYLDEEDFNQNNNISTILTHKKNRLTNSMYQGQQIFQLSKTQKQNMDLKNENKYLRDILKQNEENYKIQIINLQQKLQTKQKKIKQLQQKIQRSQRQTQMRNLSLKDKVMQCEQMIKQLQRKQFNSNSHNMLESSRIQRVNLTQRINQNQSINFNKNNRNFHDNIFKPEIVQKSPLQIDNPLNINQNQSVFQYSMIHRPQQNLNRYPIHDNLLRRNVSPQNSSLIQLSKNRSPLKIIFNGNEKVIGTKNNLRFDVKNICQLQRFKGEKYIDVSKTSQNEIVRGGMMRIQREGRHVVENDSLHKENKLKVVSKQLRGK